MRHPRLFVHTTGNTLPCCDFRQTPLSDNFGLLLCAARPFLRRSQLCLSQCLSEGSPALFHPSEGGADAGPPIGAALLAEAGCDSVLAAL